MDTGFLSKTSHRPWPLPMRAWRLAMVWHDLLFAHWPVEPERLRPLIPPGLEIDTHDGRAWVGIVPFRMTGIRHRLMPELPGLSAFAEINVRTYVRAGGRPGVWFFSLDAACRPAVWTARAVYALPYYHAEMRVTPRGARVRYESRRGGPSAEFVAEYGPIGPTFEARTGSLEHWLTERYCLYAAHPGAPGRLYRADIHHVPWPLQPAECRIESNTMTARLGVELPDARPLAHSARRLDVVAWGLERLAGVDRRYGGKARPAGRPMGVIRSSM